MTLRPADRLDADGRVRLRRFIAADAEALHEAIESSREHLRPFMPFASNDPHDLDFRRSWIDHVNESFDAGRSFNYGVFEDSELVGGCSIDPKSATDASIGYWIHGAHTRRGHATAAARALMDAAIAAGFSTVLVRHDEANIASAAIARKLRFQFVRSEPHSIDAPGQTGTSIVWAFSPHAPEVSAT